MDLPVTEHSTVLTVVWKQLDDATVENAMLKIENDELRRTVEDLRAKLKAPPY